MINNASHYHSEELTHYSVFPETSEKWQTAWAATLQAVAVSDVCGCSVAGGEWAEWELTMAALTLIPALCYSLCDPSAYLNCSLSHGQLRSNDALLLLCFRKSPLFIQFCRCLVPYGNRPPLPSNSHLLWRPRREANSGSVLQNAKWQSSDIFICRTHFLSLICN